MIEPIKYEIVGNYYIFDDTITGKKFAWSTLLNSVMMPFNREYLDCIDFESLKKSDKIFIHEDEYYLVGFMYLKLAIRGAFEAYAAGKIDVEGFHRDVGMAIGAIAAMTLIAGGQINPPLEKTAKA